MSEECARYLQEAYEGTLRMNRLIDALLNFSRLGRREPKRELVDLSAIAREEAAELKLTEPERRVVFRIVDGLVADVDTSLLRVVIGNLFGNAWKFTINRDEGLIDFGSAELCGQQAFFVRDNGLGFDMADAERIFTPFERLLAPGKSKVSASAWRRCDGSSTATAAKCGPKGNRERERRFISPCPPRSTCHDFAYCSHPVDTRHDCRHFHGRSAHTTRLCGRVALFPAAHPSRVQAAPLPHPLLPAIGSFLIIVGFFLSPSSEVAPGIAMANRSMAIAVLWAMSFIIMKRNQAQADITERKQAEEALREARAKYRSLFENAVEGMYRTTRSGRFIDANPAMARMLGYGSPRNC